MADRLPTRWQPRYALCLVTDGSLCAPRTLVEVVRAALHGGVGLVQLREKKLDSRAFVERARAIKALTAPLGVPLIINDRLDIALVVGADGLHVGQSDLSVADVRLWLPDAIIGLSIESMADLRAVPSGVDYLGVSPVFATATKSDTAPAVGLAGLVAMRAATRLPLVAIGGIGAHNARAVLRHGADSLAVVSAICAAADPRAAAAELADCIATESLNRPS